MGAPDLLAPGGLLAVEVGQDQAEAVADLWRGAGLTDVTVTNDYAGVGRVVTGRGK
jgi:release factor glutamine methyltransferase